MDNAQGSAVQGNTLKKIACVRLPREPSTSLWDITLHDGKISSVDVHNHNSPDLEAPDTFHAHNRLIAPSLCHAHVHLDKAFLLQDPKYSDLQITTGDFQEAMEMTNKAKSRFEEADLLKRGRQLINESIQYGVTAMRAFVEVDGVVHMKCLKAGLMLKDEYKEKCDIQICAFAQLPLFSGEDDGAEVRKLMEAAASYNGVEVLGSTPYVEDDEEKAKENVRWIIQLALKHEKHLDLHLDYFVEEDRKPLIWETLNIIKEEKWMMKRGKEICLGHCTRLTRFRKEDWSRLRQEIDQLPVAFIGLPTSDLFIMRTSNNVRGTLPITELINDYDLNAAISINNVGNAFTPYGNCDPLSLAQLGVGLYHAGTQKDAELLYVSTFPVYFNVSPIDATMQEAVSSRAKAAIGHKVTSLNLKPGQPADFVLFDRMNSSWRCRKSVHEVVYDAGRTRRTIYRGRITASTD
jgi:cytosine/adenosine deaminase-related metal-dependent hydrolase